MQICSHCAGFPDLLFCLETVKKDFPISIFCKYVSVTTYNENKTCSNCNEEMDSDVMYFETERDFQLFASEIAEIIGNDLSQYICYCSRCPEGNTMEYDAYKNYEKSLDEIGRGIDVYDFLTDNGVADPYTNFVINHLKCPNCNAGGPRHRKDDNSPFELSERFYSHEDIDYYFGDAVNYFAFSELAEKYGIELTEDELKEFEKYIETNPMLSNKHDVGKKLFELLEVVYEKNDYQELAAGTHLYRGRKTNIDETLNEKDMYAPPYGVSSHGRYNSVGISVLYCCNQKEQIPYELNTTAGHALFIISLKNMKKLKVLDVNNLFPGFEGFNEQNLESKNLKKAYLLTNYIRDCCYQIGYNGLMYYPEGADYVNYAFINYDSSETECPDFEALKLEKIKFEITYNIINCEEVIQVKDKSQEKDLCPF